MKKMSNTSMIGWAILLLAIGIGLEMIFKWQLLIPLLIGCWLVYKGKQKKGKRNVHFILGIVLIAIPILSSSFIKLFIIAIVLYGLYQYYHTKEHLRKLEVHTIPPQEKLPSFKRKIPYFQNFFYGSRASNTEVFEWDDINIQYGFGDVIIDLGMTMLPPGESTIIIRNLVGNVQILVPFDVAVIVNHSVMSGTLKVFEEEKTDLFNDTIIYYPNQNDEPLRTIKIMTNVLVGHVEVKRI